jgi:hypothetical protein
VIISNSPVPSSLFNPEPKVVSPEPITLLENGRVVLPLAGGDIRRPLALFRIVYSSVQEKPEP